MRICFTVLDTEKAYEYYGWIRGVNEHTLQFEADASTGEPYIRTSHLNLEAIIVYGVDEVDPEADLREKEEGKYGDVESIRSVPINDADPLLKEGYQLLDTFAKTVTLVKKAEKKEDEG